MVESASFYETEQRGYVEPPFPCIIFAQRGSASKTMCDHTLGMSTYERTYIETLDGRCRRPRLSRFPMRSRRFAPMRVQMCSNMVSCWSQRRPFSIAELPSRGRGAAQKIHDKKCCRSGQSPLLGPRGCRKMAIFVSACKAILNQPLRIIYL